MRKKAFSTFLVISALFILFTAGNSVASNFQNFTTFYGTDYASAGYGGMRDIGTGTINLTGTSGTIGDSYLYWHGPSNVVDPSANESVTFNGTRITGTSLGLSSDNCWGYDCSIAYRADVSSLVTGDGNYTLENFTKDNNSVNVNGVSLVTFFDDADTNNNRDVVIFDGNDSNISNAYDADGWNIVLNGINYTSGSAFLQFHVSDGQTFTDDTVMINGIPFLLAGPIFQGDSTPFGASDNNGSLWDILTFDITAFLNPGFNNLSITTGVFSDCLSGVVALIDLPAGAAPPINPVPEPATLLLLGVGLAGLGIWKKKRS